MNVDEGRVWPEKQSAKQTTVIFMQVMGVSPWGSYQDLCTADLTQPHVCTLSLREICEGCTPAACKNSEAVKWNCSTPLYPAVTGNTEGSVPLPLILVFLTQWGNKSGIKSKQGLLLPPVSFPLPPATAAETWADTRGGGQAQLASKPVEIWNYSVETSNRTGIKIWLHAQLWSPVWTD